MATDLPSEAPDITELGFRVSRLRVSLRIKRGEVRQLLVPEAPEIPSGSSPSPHQPLALRVSSPAECLSPVEPQRHFRSRLSSTSSVASSIDSGIVVARSRANSSASTSSNRPGNILRKIARAAIPVGTENAGFEFEGFYHTAVSRTSSTASSARSSSVSRTPSTSSSTPSTTSSSSPSKFPVTNPRVRSVSLSSSHNGHRSRICSDDSSDYADLYDTIEELKDPFDEDEEEETPPPLPPRKARLRTPALPPYPSTALRMVNTITATILC